MFRHVLVPLDLSGRHAVALRMARSLVRQTGGRVTLLHVIERIAHVPDRELRGFYRRLERTAHARLAAAAAPLARSGVRVQAVVLLGAPAQEIVRWAATKRVDLVVLSSHRVEPGRRSRGFGTTSYRVGLLCPRPVLLVK